MDLASRFHGEVINSDAMQMYEGLPMITNKIKPEEKKEVPHHLLGCISLRDQPWTVQNFVANALKIIDSIHQRGKLPVLVGGTHYYLQSLLFQESLADENHAESSIGVASELNAQQLDLLDSPTEQIFAELKRVDPVMANRWHPNDRRKIRRSLEIFLQTGKRASELYEEQRSNRASLQREEEPCGSLDNPATRLRYRTLSLWTHTVQDTLASRLDDRVDGMIRDGLVNEVQALEDTRRKLEGDDGNLDPSRGIWVAIGYKEFRHFCAERRKEFNSESQLAKELRAAVERTKISTRQYSKAQARWIRIKLFNALEDAGDPMLFVLNTDNPEEWQQRVLDPAIALTVDFLKGRTLPDPRQQSSLSELLFTSKRSHTATQAGHPWENKTCEMCGITVVTEDQWQQHLKSRRHRNTFRARTKEGNIGASAHPM